MTDDRTFDQTPKPEPNYEELLDSSLQSYDHHRFDTLSERPWRLNSQLWIAFFGGVLPATAIAYLNGKRLRIPTKHLNQIIVVGLIGLIGVIAVSYVFTTVDIPTIGGSRGMRLANRIIAVLIYLLLYSIQKSADRVYQYASEGEYDSLWKAGLLAVFGLGLLQNIAVYGVVALIEKLY